MESADCVLPIDNTALFDIVAKVEEGYLKSKKKAAGGLGSVKEGSSVIDTELIAKPKKGKEYHRENTIVANMLSDLTCSMRYEGSLNVDLNEITMNLVPFPEMKFLCSSLSPLYSILDQGTIPRGITQMFDDAINKNFQLLSFNKSMHDPMYLACGMIARGNLGISDINSNVERIKKKIKMPFWNTEGFKIGLCNQASLAQDYSLLFLSNNSSVAEVIERIRTRFMLMYKNKTNVFHFTKHGLEESHFDTVKENLNALISSYGQCEKWECKEITGKIGENEEDDEDDGIFKYHII